MIGLVGGPLAFALRRARPPRGDRAAVLGAGAHDDPRDRVGAALGIYLAWKGFRTDAPVLQVATAPSVTVPELL